MRVSKDDIAQAYLTFLGVALSDAQILPLMERIENREQLLMHILVETDFLEKKPALAEKIESSWSILSRSLNSFMEEREQIRNMMMKALRMQLSSAQRDYADKLSELKCFEEEITALRKKIDILAGS